MKALAISTGGEEEESSKTLDLFLENGTSGVFREYAREYRRRL